MTFAGYKNLVGRLIGESDGSGTDSTRDALINDAIKECSSQYALKTNEVLTTLTFSSGVIDLPTDIDFSHADKIKVYTYSGTSKTDWSEEPMDELSKYGTDDHRYSIDYANQHLKGSSDETVNFLYYKIPTDNTDTFSFPVPMAIAHLAAGQYWQSIEEDEDQAKFNFALADRLMARGAFQDKKSKTNIKINHYLKGSDLGFN